MPALHRASVNYTGNSLHDKHTYQPYMEHHPYFRLGFCKREVCAILLASVGLTQACPNNLAISQQ